MKIFKNYSILVGILLILIITLLPNLYFVAADNLFYNKAHKTEKISFELNKDVRNIQMVKRLHEILESYYGEESAREVYFIEEVTDPDDKNMSQVVDVTMKNNNDKVVKSIKNNSVFSIICKEKINNRQFVAMETNTLQKIENFDITTKTGKITGKWDKKNNKLLSLEYEGSKINKLSKEDIVTLEKEYIKNTNLQLVDDWNYNSKKASSKKATGNTKVENKIEKEANALTKTKGISPNLNLLTDSVWSASYSTNDGWYYLNTDYQLNDEENDLNKIMFVDYNKKQDKELCSKTGCKHNTNKCDSVLPKEATRSNQIFGQNGYLYLVSSEHDNEGAMSIQYYEDEENDKASTSSKFTPALYRMKLDGTEREKVMDFEKGVTFKETFLGDGESIYGVMAKIKGEKKMKKHISRQKVRNL